MLKEEKTKKHEEVIKKIDQTSFFNAGYILALLEMNAMHKEETGESFLKKIAKSMMV